MSLIKDWMKEDNLGKTNNPARALRRAWGHCLASILMEGRRKVVGAGFERAKEGMTEEEREAIKNASSDDHLKQRFL